MFLPCSPGAALVDYSATTGIWVFDTLHWSRYAMDDDSDDDDGAGANKAKAAGGGTAAASKLMPPPPPLGAAGRMNRPPASSTRGEWCQRPRKYGRDVFCFFFKLWDLLLT